MSTAIQGELEHYACYCTHVGKDTNTKYCSSIEGPYRNRGLIVIGVILITISSLFLCVQYDTVRI